MAVAEGVPVGAHVVPDEVSVRGVNDRAQLASLERIVQRRRAMTLMLAGTSIVDPHASTCAATSLRARRDDRRRLRVRRRGEARRRCPRRPVLRAARRHGRAGTRIEAFSHLDAAIIGRNCRIGPYARLRPGAALADDVHIGNFVEMKASTLGAGAKANHLAYIGDAMVGSGVNYGAGSITANYDGANKHRSFIGDDVHIGSNCVLVAPITIGAGATIGGGSTIVEGSAGGPADASRARAGVDRRLAAAAEEAADRVTGSASIMCGIVGATSDRNVVPILIEGIRRLEYRGYDSTGLAVVNGGACPVLERLVSTARVADLAAQADALNLKATTGISHTRWATHGAPTSDNAHPHLSGGEIAVVHNGIIENFEELREQLKAQGYVFRTQTDTEVIAHLVHAHWHARRRRRPARGGAACGRRVPGRVCDRRDLDARAADA